MCRGQVKSDSDILRPVAWTVGGVSPSFLRDEEDLHFSGKEREEEEEETH